MLRQRQGEFLPVASNKNVFPFIYLFIFKPELRKDQSEDCWGISFPPETKKKNSNKSHLVKL